MLKQDAYIQGKLVEMGWRWGRTSGGHLAGQMIIHAIANRVRCGWGSWLQVIDGIPKYMAENTAPTLEHPTIWQPDFIKLLHAIDGIYDGSTKDLSNGALYWGDLNKIERQWFKDLIGAENPDTGMRQHPMVSNINSLSFFK